MWELARRYSPDIRQIDLDVNRTYRNHIMFRERYNSRQVALFHVLAAYSMYNSEVSLAKITLGVVLNVIFLCFFVRLVIAKACLRSQRCC